MEPADTNGYRSTDAARSELEGGPTGEELKGLLNELISSSGDLNVRVWLDRVYTNLDDARIHSDWMKGREVYFKVEGQVDGLRDAGALPARRG